MRYDPGCRFPRTFFPTGRPEGVDERRDVRSARPPRPRPGRSQSGAGFVRPRGRDRGTAPAGPGHRRYRSQPAPLELRANACSDTVKPGRDRAFDTGAANRFWLAIALADPQRGAVAHRKSERRAVAKRRRRRRGPDADADDLGRRWHGQRALEPAGDHAQSTSQPDPATDADGRPASPATDADTRNGRATTHAPSDPPGHAAPNAGPGGQARARPAAVPRQRRWRTGPQQDDPAGQAMQGPWSSRQGLDGWQCKGRLRIRSPAGRGHASWHRPSQGNSPVASAPPRAVGSRPGPRRSPVH
jgi:hypothetical protein